MAKPLVEPIIRIRKQNVLILGKLAIIHDSNVLIFKKKFI